MTQNNSAPIHNYCDRWCERCFLTSRCGIYDNILGNQDADNETFWKNIGVQLEQSMQLLLTEARKQGIDLDSLIVDDTLRERIKRQNREHPAARLSLRYAKAVFNWKQNCFTENPESIGGNRTTSSLKNCLEVVSWYELFIHAKIMRALSGKFSEDLLPEDDMPKDHDGSAKIALIAIERSTKAWSTLLMLIPEHTLEIVGFMATLEHLQILLEKEFPEAWSFIRPGFDEG